MTLCPNPRCGRGVPLDLDWCPACGTYVRWEPTGMAPGVISTRLAPLAAPRAPVALTLIGREGEAMRAPTLAVRPGERETLRVRAEGVADVQVAVDGLPAGWWSVTPASQEGEFTVTLRPPCGPEATPGDWPLRVVARPAGGGDPLGRAAATLRVGRFEAIDAALEPAQRGRYRVRVRNQGNAIAVVSLVASDAAQRCRVEVVEPHTRIAPGDSHETDVLVRPRRPRLVGAPVEHRITAVVRAGGAPVCSLTATFEQRAWLRVRGGVAPAPVRGGYSLVLGDGTRAPIADELTLGRAAGNQLRLADPAVSRRHARLAASPHGVEVHDLGSRSGTFVAGRRVAGCVVARDGQQVRVGDTRLRVERDRSESEAAPTVIVPAGCTLHVDARGEAVGSVAASEPLPTRPRLRSGWALKRLAASEGERRYVLENLRTQRFLALTAAEARLLERLDGQRSVPELVRAVGADDGESGVRRLLELLTELAELEMLAGAEATPEARVRGWRALLRPRDHAIAHAPALVSWLYRAGARHLFTRPGRLLMAATSVAGACAFAIVIARGGVRPFRVGGELALGSAAFVVGRIAVVALHELGHALALLALGRRPRRIGIKLVAIFPYAFVDTSDAWYEPRRRRIAVSAAGPATDALVAGSFALVAFAIAGIGRDIAFQLALGAYLGAVLNLNPLLERDGYHMLADLVGEPNLRRRGVAHAGAWIARKGGDASRAVRIYGLAALCWGVLTACFAGALAMWFTGRHTGDSRLAIALGALALTAALVPTTLVVVSACAPGRFTPTDAPRRRR